MWKPQARLAEDNRLLASAMEIERKPKTRADFISGQPSAQEWGVADPGFSAVPRSGPCERERDSDVGGGTCRGEAFRVWNPGTRQKP